MLKADLIMDAILDVYSPGHVFYKVTKRKIQPLIVPTAPLWEQAQPFLVQSSSTRACFLCQLWGGSIMHIHEHPLHLHSPRNLLPTPKDGAEIRNQGKPGSLKWTQHCSINWQQKIARQSENLNRNTEKCFEWKPTNLREVWDVPGDNSPLMALYNLSEKPLWSWHTCLFSVKSAVCPAQCISSEVCELCSHFPCTWGDGRQQVCAALWIYEALHKDYGYFHNNSPALPTFEVRDVWCWTRQAEHTQKPN